MHPYRYLLPASERLKLERLNPDSNPSHYHHLAEVQRRRLQVSGWLQSEKEKIGESLTPSVRFTGLANEGNERVKRLLDERDDRIIKAVLDIARIRKKSSRQTILEASRAFVKERHHSSVEHFLFLKDFAHLTEIPVSQEEKQRFKAAFTDWLHAFRMFQPHEEQIF